MLVLFEGFGLILLALWIFCIFDVITTDPSSCRALPRTAWLIIVILLPDLGSIMWLLAGRPRSVPVRADFEVPRRSPGPDDDEEFLQGLRDRAESQRRRAREQKPDEEV
ncbi:MAG: PLD nuclease N-terminal domain-containing protein [Streptosporangiaceae bacterium]